MAASGLAALISCSGPRDLTPPTAFAPRTSASADRVFRTAKAVLARHDIQVRSKAGPWVAPDTVFGVGIQAFEVPNAAKRARDLKQEIWRNPGR